MPLGGGWVVSPSNSTPGVTAIPGTYAIAFVAGTQSTSSSTGEYLGIRSIDMADYPSIPGLTRTMKLEGMFQSSVDNTIITVQLVDLDGNSGAGANVGSAATNAGAFDQTLPLAFTVTLTVGTSDGTLRSDVVHRYGLKVSQAGAVTDRAIISNAQITPRYTA